MSDEKYHEEAFGILKDIDATVTKVWLLRTLDTAGLHVVLIKLPLTISAAFPCIPLLLQVPAK